MGEYETEIFWVNHRCVCNSFNNLENHDVIYTYSVFFRSVSVAFSAYEYVFCVYHLPSYHSDTMSKRSLINVCVRFFFVLFENRAPQAT